MSAPLLTLCLIARDEEARIEACLLSASELVDEMVVVDTGSSDATPTIAERLGARVKLQPWEDDFARARNAALDEARSPWVLVMDADERVSECAPQALRDQLRGAGEDVDAFTVRIDNRLDGGGTSCFRAVRVFRRHPRIRYRGAIHEEVTSAIAELRGRPADPPPAQLVLTHSGYVWEAREERDRRERNLRLLRRALKGDSRQALLRLTLARELLMVSGERVFPGEGFEEALDCLARAREAAARESSPVHLMATILATSAAALIADARPVEALELLEDAPQLDADRGEALLLEFARARALLAAAGDDRARLARAERAFAGLVGRNPEIGYVDLDVRVPGIFAIERMAEALGRMGRRDDALALLDEAAALEPSYGGCLVRRAQVHLLHGEVQAGLQAYADALNRDGYDPEAWIGTARVLNLLGEREQAVECARNALQLVPLWGEAILELATHHLLADRPGAVMDELSTLRDASPEADVACLIADVIGGQALTPLAEWPQRRRVERAMLSLTRALAAGRRPDLLQRLKLPLGQALSGTVSHDRTARPPVHTDFILLSHPRSGTNNLLGILNQHPEIVCVGEIFNPQDTGPAYARELGLGSLVEQRDVARLGEFFTATRQREGKRVVGFKLFCYQLETDALRHVIGDPRICKILLRRENLLRAYVSWAVAKRTAQWRLRDESRKLPDPFEIDLQEAHGWLQRNRDELDRCRDWMQDAGVPFFECSYETLFNAETLNRIYRFLGATAKDDFEHAYRVQRSAEVYQRITNLEQLEEAFGATFGSLGETAGSAAGASRT